MKNYGWKYAIYSGIYGGCVGDAFGVPLEFVDDKRLLYSPITEMRSGGAHNQERGTWSDDSSMTLALCESLGEKRGIDGGDIMSRFIRWYDEGEYTVDGRVFDVGNACSRAILRGKEGVAPFECGGRDVRDNGNGSLMRILPLTYYLLSRYGTRLTNHREAMETVHNVSALTHGHPLAQSACGIYCCVAVRLLRACIDGETSEAQDNIKRAVEGGVAEALRYYAKEECFQKANGWWEFLADPEILRLQPIEEVLSGGFVVETLGASLWCLLHTESYRDCVVTSANLGQDADTTACVAGGLAGLAYGYERIPEEWLNVLRGKRVVERCLGAFSTLFAGREEN